MTKAHELDVRRFDAVLFDLDGVVTKTARVHAAAWKKLFDGYLERKSIREGKPFLPFDAQTDYRQYVDGKPRHEGVKSFLESRAITLHYGDPGDDPSAETICGLGNRKNDYFREALKEMGVETFASSVAFVHEAKRRGLKTAIVSSSKNCGAVLEAAGLTDLFDVKVDGQDMARGHLKGKPAPDIFVRAASLLEIAPERTVIVEDALAGVEAGRSGSFGLVVGVDRVGQGDALVRHGADLVVSDLAELAFGNGGSP